MICFKKPIAFNITKLLNYVYPSTKIYQILFLLCTLIWYITLCIGILMFTTFISLWYSFFVKVKTLWKLFSKDPEISKMISKVLAAFIVIGGNVSKSFSSDRSELLNVFLPKEKVHLNAFYTTGRNLLA